MKRRTGSCTLRIGDRVRYVRVPGDGVPGYFMHKDTLRLFKRLVAKRTILRIREIDEYENPWVRIRFKNERGKWEVHDLAVSDADADWEIVERINRNRKRSVSGRTVSSRVLPKDL